MKHALLLISSYGIDPLKRCLMQYFKYQDVFDIYIHVDGKTLDELNKFKITVTDNSDDGIEYIQHITQLSNIKYVKHKHSCARFSFGLLLAEFHLFRKAFETSEYISYHVVSESCFFYKDINAFVDYFDTHKDYDFIDYFQHQISRAFNNHPLMSDKKYFKSSQWISLSQKTLNRIIEEDLFTRIYQDKISDFITYPCNGAYDEIVLQTYIINEIYTPEDLQKPEYKPKVSRIISWYNNNDRPNTMTYDFFSKNKWTFNHKHLYSGFFVRKIDVYNKNSLELVEYFNEKYGKFEQ